VLEAPDRQLGMQETAEADSSQFRFLIPSGLCVMLQDCSLAGYPPEAILD
jgi:hypothetical protein